MHIFTYPLFFKFLYRYGNIPVTLLLSIYLIPVVINLDVKLIYFIPFIITLLLIYFLNKHYIFLYKILPYKIIADNDKMIGANFIFSSKEVIIYYNDIETLSGGIFDGKLRGVMKVYDGKNKISIGFYNRIKNSHALETLILSRVRKEVYNEVIERVGLKRKRR